MRQNEELTQKELRRALFAPRSLAIVGQSDDPDKTAGRPLKFLRQAGFAGRVYPINARRREVLGEPAYPSLDALPEVPEHAYILTPADAALDAVEACARTGVAVATVLADGFAEQGAAGLAREARLKKIVAGSGMRVVGPSSLGIVNLRNGALITANAAFDEPDLPAGSIFAASHSGGMIGTLLSRGRACGVGFAGLVSVGNEVDLALGDICAATLDDPEITGYLLFLETLRHADRLREFAMRAAAAGKPVLAYKLGRSEPARELAATHTGALAGEDDIADAFLCACGIARVETLSALIEGLPLLARVPACRRKRSPRVAVVTTTAGGAAMVVDQLACRGVDVAAPDPATHLKFHEAGIVVARARLVDLTLAGTRYDTMKTALDILTTAAEFDLVVAVVGSSARFHPQLAVQPIIDTGRMLGEHAHTPIAVFLVPEAPQARIALGKAGIANFYTPEACADAVAAALTRRPPQAMATPATAASAAAPSQSATAVPVGAAPHAAASSSRESDAGRVLDEWESGLVLDRLGILRARCVAIDINGALPALPFDYPLAVKVLSADMTHKSDVGGVALNIANEAALRAAIAAMRTRLPSAERLLVQPMISGVGEVLIGYRRDGDVGPLVMLAAGGIFAEIHRDRSLRLAPIDIDTAHEMIAEVRVLKTLAGWRGRPPGDLAAVAGALAALSQLATDPAVMEAEVNPLIIRPTGAVAVDAMVRRR